MKRLMLQIQDDIYNILKKEIKEGKWSSMADGIRYYTRRGMETCK